MHRGGGVEVEGRKVGGCVWVCQDRKAVLRSRVTTATRWMEETKRGAADIEERKGNRKEIRIDLQKLKIKNKKKIMLNKTKLWPFQCKTLMQSELSPGWVRSK